MTFSANIELAEKYLGLTFRDKNLLKIALTHRSFSLVSGERIFEVNERLEFLGDAILSFVITDFIFNQFPQFSEGDLAKLRASLVNSNVLADIGSKISLGECILLGKGTELTGGRERTSILADCFEAIIGAIYIDQGIEVVRQFIIDKFRDIILASAENNILADFKTNLQELTAQKFGLLPEYKIVSEEGPVHEKIFNVEVLIDKKVYGRGKGKSKKKAEQAAAEEAFEHLKEKTEED
ncbi:MAG: ribonuclease III [Actinobacteria bacterium]|nr:ribonuclease III [Actinomycetota bacterium]